MELEGLRGEIERLFELDELLELSSFLLGLEPSELGGTETKASFVRALTARCAASGALEALCEAVVATKPHAEAALRRGRISAFFDVPALAPGQSVGGYEILRSVGSGPSGSSFQARRAEGVCRLKALHPEASRDPRSVQRFLTLARLASRVEHPALPRPLRIGQDGGRHFLVTPWFEGESLRQRLNAQGPLLPSEALGVLLEIAAALGALHAARVVHGNLKLENLLIPQRGLRGLLVQDAGVDALRSHKPLNGRQEILPFGSVQSLSPERLRGGDRQISDDLYGAGVVLYELLAGRPPFSGESAADIAFQRFAQLPPPPSTFAPPGWITPDLDRFALRLLAIDPRERPADARALQQELERLSQAGSNESRWSADDVRELVADVFGQPDESERLRAIEGGCDSLGLAALYTTLLERARAAAELPGERTPAERTQLSGWLLRAGRGFQSIGHSDDAIVAYRSLHALGGDTPASWENLQSLLEQRERYDELAEALLARLETTSERPARARLFARLGEVHETSSTDPSQAAMAFAQAFCEDPSRSEYVRKTEQATASNEALWHEVLASCAEAASNDTRSPSERVLLLEQTGTWYADRLNRAELALPCFQSVLQLDPGRKQALDRVAAVYRQNHMWSELSELLTQRSSVVASPSDARALRTEAAEILALRLDDQERAQEIYESVLSEDPEDRRALRGLTRLYTSSSDYERLAPLLEKQLQLTQGQERLTALCNLAEAYRGQPGKLSEARQCYEAVLKEAPDHPLARAGLERVLRDSGQHRELLERWLQELAAAPTPRRQVDLLEQVADVYEQEFLLPADAAMALERVLLLDPTRLPALLHLQRVYRSLERWPDLANAYAREAELRDDPPQKADAVMRRARVLAEHLHDLPAALEAYHLVRKLDASRIDASEALADLYEALGNAAEATQVLRDLSEQVEQDDKKTRYSLRAARLLELEGAAQEAADLYRRVLTIDPKNKRAVGALKGQYRAHGDIPALLEVLRKDVAHAETDVARAELAAEIAELEQDELGDPVGAEATARQAIAWDPTNFRALIVLGDLAFAAGNRLEALELYDRILPRIRAVGDAAAARVLGRYLEIQDPTDEHRQKLLAAAKRLVELRPADSAGVSRAGALAFDYGAWEQAYTFYQTLLDNCRAELSGPALGEATYRLGESLRHCGDAARALPYLEEATEYLPRSPLPLRGQLGVFVAQGDKTAQLRVSQELIELVDDDEKAQLLIDVGDIQLELGRSDLALAAFEDAERRSPHDRRLLSKLMALYTEQQDWEKLVDVVMRLAHFVVEPKQKAKYLMTAAMVSARNLGRKQDALDHYSEILKLDPDHSKALSEFVVLQIERGNNTAAEQALRARLELTRERGDTPGQLEMLDALYTLCSGSPGQLHAAVETVEAARALDPDNIVHGDRLADLYERDTTRYLDRAVDLHMQRLQQRPDDSNAYRRLRRLYTGARQADAAWCLCRVLHLLKLAEPEEARFFERLRSPHPAPAVNALDESDWRNLVIHPSVDPMLSRVFELIEPVVIAVRSQPLSSLGYDPQLALDTSQHPYPLGHLLHYAAGVMGMSTPPVFENHHEMGGLLFLNSQPPSVVLGLSALQMNLPAQTAAFIAARHLTFYRSGFHVRHLLSSVPALKAWLFAAFRLAAAGFSVGAELEGPVAEARAALERFLAPEAKEQLLELVTRMLESGTSLDLRQWITGIDLTADRVGLLLANDLKSVTDIVKSVDDPSAPPREKRLQEVILYSISRPFFTVRQRLGVAIVGG